jgi:hypothetical protein
MQNRKNWAVSIIAMLMVASMAACTAAPVAVPDRPIEVSVETALAAQNKAAGLMMGNAEWTEEEFSSLLSVLLEQNSGENNPVEDVNVWFEPNNQVFIRVNLKEGVIPAGNTLDLAGSVSVENNQVVVDLQQAGAGNLSVTGAILDPLSAQINAALADPSMGVAVDVSTETGMISVGLGM